MNSDRIKVGLRSSDIVWAYTLLRIIMGVNYFNHGFTRMGNIPGFMDAMVGAMEGAWMPEWLVRMNAALVPPVELIVGFLLIFGLFTRYALIAGLILMIVLMYGVTIVQNWDTAGGQLIYDLILFLLLAGLGFNKVSLDEKFWGNKSSHSSEDSPEGIMQFVRRKLFKRRRKYHPSSQN
ncbi:DoxX family protein [Spirulina sp. CS-785/01]|uniref:DoxX family protein n=1 Tax=Spirulina sp. CS-785/01 TaxID=3021716 RepID=UPI00232FD4A6|nr:DoxX family protein [Spirulina sp. CS-785/01]MDB9312114.1 DoxX family protein [Spirulina sp. CS-785/01]